MIAQLNDIAQIWWQWMGSMFWQVSLFIILITLLDMAIRRWAWPQVRYVLWGLVFLKLIIPPTWQMPTSVVSWIQPKVEEQIPIQIKTMEWTVKDHQTSAMSSPAEATEPGVTEKASWQTIVLLTWLTGMIVFALLLIIKMSQLPKRSQRPDIQDTPEWFYGLLAKTAQSLSLKKIPVVVFSKDVKSPAVFGIFHTALLLPVGYLDRLSEEQAEHVLIHELCHLKRGDLLVHWFCLLLQIIYWFNPLLIWTRRQMRHVCEICCDLSVADILREKTIAYRETLIATARELLAETVEPGLGLLGVFEEPFRLVSRLKWLEKKTWENRKRKVTATVCTTLIMVVCVMPMAGVSQTTMQSDDVTIESNSQRIQDKNSILVAGLSDTTTQNKDFSAQSKTNPVPSDSQQPQDKSSVLLSDVSQPNSQDNDPAVRSDAAPVETNSREMQDRNDIFQPMILIEGIIMEVDEGTALDLGVKMQGAPTESQMDQRLPMGIINKGIAIGEKSFTDIKAAIEAMKTEPGIHILGTPQMATLNNQKTTLDTSNPKQGLGYVLDITPQILENGMVRQEIRLKISQPIGEESSGKNIIKREIKTTVMVMDGSTMVMGMSGAKDPVGQETSTDKNNLYILLTTQILKTPEKVQSFQLGLRMGS